MPCVHAQRRHTVVCWCFCLSVILSVTGIAAQRVQFKCWNMHNWVQSHVFSDLNWLDFEIKLGFRCTLLNLKVSSLLDVFNDNLAHSESFYNPRVSGVPCYSSRPQQNSAKLSLKQPSYNSYVVTDLRTSVISHAHCIIEYSDWPSDFCNHHAQMMWMWMHMQVHARIRPRSTEASAPQVLSLISLLCCTGCKLKLCSIDVMFTSLSLPLLLTPGCLCHGNGVPH